jgi:hypothetical protein
VTFEAEGNLDHPLETMRGKGSVHLAAGSFHHQPFSGADVTYELTPGRLHIPQGTLRFDTGTAAFHGGFGVLQPFSGSDDQLSIHLHHVPAGFMDQESSIRSAIPLLNGQLTVQSASSGQVRLAIDLEIPKTIRRVPPGKAMAEVELPSLHLSSHVLTSPPWTHWQASAVHLQGEGITAALTDVVAHRTSTHYELSAAVDLQASTEAIAGLVGGLLPASLRISGPLGLAGRAAGHIAPDGSVSLRDLTFTGNLHLAQVDWDDALWEAVAAQLTLAQGRLAIDKAQAQTLGGWLRFTPETFVDLQGPNHDFHVHLTAEQLNLQLETGKRLRLLSLMLPLFLFDSDRKDPIRMSGILNAELQASGTYNGQPDWSQSVNGDGSFRITEGTVIGSTLISGFVAKALTLPGSLVDQSLKTLLDGSGKALQVIAGLLRHAFDFGTIASPIAVHAGEIHLTPNFTLSAPEFSLVINGYSTLDGGLDYDVHSDLVHRSLFGEAINLAEKLPLLGPVLRHINPFHLIHRHIEISATVRGNIFQHNAAGQPDVHINVYFTQ